jgi:5-methylcytosine-specific restriction protein A
MPLRVSVFMVCGAPAAGKSTFVKQNKKVNDLISDLDEIKSRITKQPVYSVFDAETLNTAIQLRNQEIELLQYKGNKEQTLWLIVGAPEAKDREHWKEILKPGKIFILFPPEKVCYERIENDVARSKVLERQKRAVYRWYRDYTPLENEIIIPDFVLERA